MTAVETPFFLRKAAGLLADTEREQLIQFVGTNPEVGDVVPESGGVRKVRWAAKARGKAAGTSETASADGDQESNGPRPRSTSIFRLRRDEIE